MSLAYPHERLQLPETPPPPVARLPPAGLDDQDGRGGVRRGLRRRGRGLPAALRARPRLGHAGLAPRRALPGGGRRLPADTRRRSTGGSGATAGSSSSRGCSAAEASGGRRPAPRGSSSWSRTTSSRPGRGHSARRRSARSPKDAQTRDFSDCGAGPSPSALGDGWPRCRSPRRSRWASRSSRRRPVAPGRVCRPVGRRPAVHLRRARADLPDQMVVAHGEPFSVDREACRPRPSGGPSAARPSSASRPRSPPRSRTAGIAFSLPSQLDSGWLDDPGRRRHPSGPDRAEAPARADRPGRRR